MKILVTGGAGYLGSTLSRLLINEGHYVRVLDSLLFGVQPIASLFKHDRFQLIRGDIRHVEDAMRAMNDVEAVVDLAAIVGAPACNENRMLTMETNYWATKLLAQIAASQKVNKFLFASTCSVYGANNHEPLDESAKMNPLSLYAETKLKSEKALLALKNEVKPIILRLSTLCGPSPRMRFDLVLNIMTATAYFERQVRIYGGNQWRPLLDVEDAARAFAFLLTYDDVDEEPIYNIGSNDNNITIKDLAKKISDCIEGVELMEYPEKTDSRSYRVQFDKIRTTGYETKYDINASIGRVYSYLKAGHVTDFKDPIYSNSGKAFQQTSAI